MFDWIQNTLLQSWLGYDVETVLQSCSVKNVSLEISENPQKDSCARVAF